MGNHLTMKEAGKLGGQTTKKKMGEKFFSKIGKKGGKTTSERYDGSYFSSIGRLGGMKRSKSFKTPKG